MFYFFVSILKFGVSARDFFCSDDRPRVGGADGIGGRGVANNSEVYECGAGGGGNAGENSNGLNAVAHYTWDYNFLMCGAGGGGAPNGAGGDEASALSGENGGGASVAGGQDSGGDGGKCMAYSWFDQWWCNQCFIFFVLVFVPMMMVVGMGGAQCKK